MRSGSHRFTTGRENLVSAGLQAAALIMADGSVLWSTGIDSVTLVSPGVYSVQLHVPCSTQIVTFGTMTIDSTTSTPRFNPESGDSQSVYVEMDDGANHSFSIMISAGDVL